MKSFSELKIKLFADGADKRSMLKLYQNPYVKGFTTNPSLMKKAGVVDYQAFAKEILSEIPDRSISFEVFADEIDEMEMQAHEIASWGKNVVVKIPVTNTRGEFTGALLKKLSHSGISLNVTALFTVEQVREVAKCLAPETPAIVSVFAGRIADTGRDPEPIMRESLALLSHLPRAELLWASPRELLNIFQADALGCHIITATPDILAKLDLYAKDLKEFSLETVRGFYTDAMVAGYCIATEEVI